MAMFLGVITSGLVPTEVGIAPQRVRYTNSLRSVNERTICYQANNQKRVPKLSRY